MLGTITMPKFFREGITYNSFIKQPYWHSLECIQFKLVFRGKIIIMDIIIVIPLSFKTSSFPVSNSYNGVRELPFFITGFPVFTSYIGVRELLFVITRGSCIKNIDLHKVSERNRREISTYLLNLR